MTKQEIIEMIHRAGFEAVERDFYNRIERIEHKALIEGKSMEVML